ncbi:hypothetical protein LTSERUB_2498 [Salmonella enterica subsp. enterica serovar Rubislaw str. A4-653]|uniref:Uncharacterized protein n=1 Tax=Salmonella enterica subsp. enterica serovar Rubislaw str. A4-653 TaxID=913081 RepID=G5QIV0_SALRU|nr:hypothetical protein LTSERUB_2498 [Salmonella enterica subsp. enterica serovar Rubislaw str. A4-653]
MGDQYAQYRKLTRWWATNKVMGSEVSHVYLYVGGDRSNIDKVFWLVEINMVFS